MSSQRDSDLKLLKDNGYTMDQFSQMGVTEQDLKFLEPPEEKSFAAEAVDTVGAAVTGTYRGILKAQSETYTLFGGDNKAADDEYFAEVAEQDAERFPNDPNVLAGAAWLAEGAAEIAETGIAVTAATMAGIGTAAGAALTGAGKLIKGASGALPGGASVIKGTKNVYDKVASIFSRKGGKKAASKGSTKPTAKQTEAVAKDAAKDKRRYQGLAEKGHSDSQIRKIMSKEKAARKTSPNRPKSKAKAEDSSPLTEKVGKALKEKAKKTVRDVANSKNRTNTLKDKLDTPQKKSKVASAIVKAGLGLL